MVANRVMKMVRRKVPAAVVARVVVAVVVMAMAVMTPATPAGALSIPGDSQVIDEYITRRRRKSHYREADRVKMVGFPEKEWMV